MPEPINNNVTTTLQPIAGDFLQQLQQEGKITPQESANIRTLSQQQGRPLEDVLMSLGKISEGDLYKAKAAVSGYKFIDLVSTEISIDTMNKISKDVAQKHIAVPFEESNGRIKVAMADPGDLQKTKFLQILMGKPLDVYMAAPSQIKNVIDKQYAARITEEVEEALEDVGDVVELNSAAAKRNEDISKEGLDSAPVSRIVNMILEYAVKYKASDVHIEPREKHIIVRFRISGVLIEKLTLPRKLGPAVVSRIKILSDLKIDEHRLPQDGRFQIKVGEKYFDLRVSIMPNIYGEKVVMRLLERGGGELMLEDTGLRGYALKLYKEALTKTEGIILVTGPTGSGKTHTLASSLRIINKPTVNILTLEDPVEIRVDGVTQVQVNPDIGLTFASGMRAFLRQDPDIIMVGEIRDMETAELAVQAALTGHLVLATLHTNSAAGAMPRLLDMDIETYLISSTVNTIVGQRLVRKICDFCKKGYVARQDEVMELHKRLDGLKGFDLYSYPPRRDVNGQAMSSNQNKEVILYKGEGCNKCNGSGYAGRLGIFEVMDANEKISQLVMEHRSAFEIEQQAKKDGMITMIQDGYLKALEGVTTLQEVIRVVN